MKKVLAVIGIIAAVAAAIVFSVQKWEAVAPDFDDIRFSDAKYVRSFILPATPIFGTGQRFYDNGSLAFDQDAGELWIYCKGGLTRISIPPDPGHPPSAYMDNPGICPVAQPYGERVKVDSLLAGFTSPAQTFGGFAILNGRIECNWSEFYNVAGRDNLSISSIALDGSDPRGGWRVGPAGWPDPVKDTFHANKVSGWMTVLPARWANANVGGRRIAVSDQRGAGAFGGDFGPGVYVYSPDPTAPPGGGLGGMPLLVYPGTGTNGWDPGYTNGERRSYSSMEAIWTGRRSLSFVHFWMKGTPPNFYGNCPSPGCPDCNKGWHSGPYRPMAYVTAGTDLARVARGELRPWEVQPLEEVELTFVWDNPLVSAADPNCKRPYVTGSAYDGRRYLYLLQLRAYKPCPSCNPLPAIHVVDCAPG